VREVSEFMMFLWTSSGKEWWNIPTHIGLDHWSLGRSSLNDVGGKGDLEHWSLSFVYNADWC